MHRAPLHRLCAAESNPVAEKGTCALEETDTPTGWTVLDFDDSNWPAAVEHTADEFGPKDGYDRVDGGNSARLVGATIWCRTTPCSAA